MIPIQISLFPLVGMACSLSAFHKYENQLDKVRFIGVHTGHLGFYTDYRDFELDKLVTNLQLDTGARVSYPVECEGFFLKMVK